MSDPNTPAPPPSGGKREAKAQAKAEKAHTKAMRPWYKKKRFILPLGVVALIVIIAATSGGGEDDETPIASDEIAEEQSPEEAGEEPAEEQPAEEQPEIGGPGSLYPDRPDQQSEDHEAAVGEPVMLSGYTATVRSASLQQGPLGDPLVTVDVTVENRDDVAQAYNTFDWRIQTPNGQVLDPTFMGDNTLGSGDLVSGGTVEGQVSFEVGPGTYYVIYKPDAFDAARGIWQITVG